MNMKQNVVVAAALLAQSMAFAADPVRMDFEGLTTSVSGLRADVAVSDFYNGGSSKVPGTSTAVVAGAVPGIGANFSSSAWVTETSAGGNGGTSSVFGTTRNLLLENGSTIANSTALGNGVLYSPTADSVSLTFAAGFSTGVSFFFNSASDLTVSILSNTGTTLVSEDFSFASSALCPTGQSRCEWNAASLGFTGTAFGVSFSGVRGTFALDNVTLGQLDPLAALTSGGNGGNGGGSGGGNTGGGGTGGGTDPGVPPVVPGGGGGVITPIPEPSTYALMALGLVAVGWATRRRTATPA